MQKSEFLSYEGLERLVDDIWGKVSDIFVRESDPRLAHLDYDVDSSTLVADGSISAESLVVGGDVFDAIESEIIDSSNPIQASAVFKERERIQQRLSNIENQIMDIWRELDAKPIRYREGELVINTLHEALKEIKVIREILLAIDSSTGEEKGLPEDIFSIDSEDPEMLNIAEIE